MRMSDQINDLAAALVKAQGEIGGAKKDSENPHFRSSYADLASVWDACRAPLTKHGLCVMQFPRLTVSDGGVLLDLETVLAHTSGQFMAETLSVIVSKPDAQGIGSALTYARRYALSAVVGVAPEDDDGESAVGRGSERQKDAKPAGAMDTVSVKVLGIESKPAGNRTKFILNCSDHKKYGTFDPKVKETAESAQEAAAYVEITFKDNAWGGRDAVSVKEVEPAL